MMNRFRMTGLLLTMTIAILAANKQTANIDRVTIFTSGAQVERSRTLQLAAGEQTITFTGLSPYVDANSMQLKAKGQLTVLGVSLRTAHPDSAAQAQSLRQATENVKAVERRIQQNKDEQEMLASQLELVKANCSVAGRTVATPLANIKELNSYYAQEVLQLKKRTQQLDEQLLQLKDELAQKQATRDSLAKLRLSTVTEIDVKVSARQAGRADFSITYYVKNSGWYPSYDVRSNSTSEPLQLSYKANIYQNTKEEWKNIPVTLSSSNPNRSGTAPELGTYWLDFEREVTASYSKSRPRANAMILERRVQMEEAMAVDEAEAEESTVIETVQQQARFGYEFAIKPLLTLPNGGRSNATAIEIARHELAAKYEYRGYPKMDKDAFLVADATDWMKLNLLAGEANVFFDNTFVGKSMLDPMVASDTLHFSLGRDQSVRMERVKVNDSSSRRFLGSNQEQTMTWRITVKNGRQEAVALTVFDQMPVARNSAIEVSVGELSGGQYDKDKGLVSWPLQLQPGEQRELILQYKVKYPKNRRISLE